MKAKEVHRSHTDFMEKGKEKEKAKVSHLRSTTSMLPIMQVKMKPMKNKNMTTEIGKNKKSSGMKKRKQHTMPKKTMTHSKKRRNLLTRTSRHL